MQNSINPHTNPITIKINTDNRRKKRPMEKHDTVIEDWREGIHIVSGCKLIFAEKRCQLHFRIPL